MYSFKDGVITIGIGYPEKRTKNFCVHILFQLALKFEVLSSGVIKVIQAGEYITLFLH